MSPSEAAAALVYNCVHRPVGAACPDCIAAYLVERDVQVIRTVSDRREGKR